MKHWKFLDKMKIRGGKPLYGQICEIRNDYTMIIITTNKHLYCTINK